MTAFPIKYPVEFLRDGKGVYGIGVPKEAEVDHRPTDLIFRRDRLRESDPYCFAVLQMISGGFRHGMFAHMSEERFRQVIHHGMLRRAGLPWRLPVQHRCFPGGGHRIPSGKSTTARSFTGFDWDHSRIVNRLIAHGLDLAADQEAVKVARRFPFRCWYPIYRATALSPRALQITAAFPTLALAIFVRPTATCDWDAATCDWDTARRVSEAAADRSREASPS